MIPFLRNKGGMTPAPPGAFPVRRRSPSTRVMRIDARQQDWLSARLTSSISHCTSPLASVFYHRYNHTYSSSAQLILRKATRKRFPSKHKLRKFISSQYVSQVIHHYIFKEHGIIHVARFEIWARREAHRARCDAGYRSALR